MECEILGDVLPLDPLDVPPRPECLVGRPEGLTSDSIDSLIASGLTHLDEAYANKERSCFFCGSGAEEAAQHPRDLAIEEQRADSVSAEEKDGTPSSLPPLAERRVYCWLLGFANSGGRRRAGQATFFLDRCALCALRYSQMQRRLCRAFLFHRRNPQYVGMLRTSWLGFDLLRLFSALHSHKAVALSSGVVTAPARVRISRRLRSALAQILVSSEELLDPLREVDAASLCSVVSRFAPVPQFLRFLLAANGNLRNPPFPVGGGDSTRLRRLRKQIGCLRAFVQITFQHPLTEAASTNSGPSSPPAGAAGPPPSAPHSLLRNLVLSPFILLLPLLPSPLTFVWTNMSLALETQPGVAERVLPQLLSLQEHWMPSLAVFCRAALHAAVVSSPASLSAECVWRTSEGGEDAAAEEGPPPTVLSKLLRVAEHWLKVLASLSDRLQLLLGRRESRGDAALSADGGGEELASSARKPNASSLSPRLLGRLELQLRALGALYIEVFPKIPEDVAAVLRAAELSRVEAAAAVSELNRSETEAADPQGSDSGRGGCSGVKKKEVKRESPPALRRTFLQWQRCAALAAALKIEDPQRTASANRGEEAEKLSSAPLPTDRPLPPRELSQNCVAAALEIIDSRHEEALVIPLLGAESVRPVGLPLLLHTAVVAGLALSVVRRAALKPQLEALRDRQRASADKQDSIERLLLPCDNSASTLAGAAAPERGKEKLPPDAKEEAAGTQKASTTDDDFLAWLTEEIEKSNARPEADAIATRRAAPVLSREEAEAERLRQEQLLLDVNSASLCRCAVLAVHLAEKALATPSKRGVCRCVLKEETDPCPPSLAALCSAEQVALTALGRQHQERTKSAKENAEPRDARVDQRVAEPAFGASPSAACGVCVSRSLSPFWKGALRRWRAVAEGFAKLLEQLPKEAQKQRPPLSNGTLAAVGEAGGGGSCFDDPLLQSRESRASSVALMPLLRRLASSAGKVGERAAALLEEETRAEDTRLPSELLSSAKAKTLDSEKTPTQPPPATRRSGASCPPLAESFFAEDAESSESPDADLLAALDAHDLFLEAEAESLTSSSVRVEETWLGRQLKLQQISENERRRREEERREQQQGRIEVVTISSDSANSSKQSSASNSVVGAGPSSAAVSSAESASFKTVSSSPTPEPLSSPRPRQNKSVDDYRRRAQGIFSESLKAMADQVRRTSSEGFVSPELPPNPSFSKLISKVQSQGAGRSASRPEPRAADQVQTDAAGDETFSRRRNSDSTEGAASTSSKSLPAKSLSPASRLRKAARALQALEQRAPEKRRGVILDTNERLPPHPVPRKIRNVEQSLAEAHKMSEGGLFVGDPSSVGRREKMLRREEELRQTRMRQFCHAREAARAALKKFSLEVLEADLFELVLPAREGGSGEARGELRSGRASQALSRGVLCRDGGSQSAPLFNCLLRAESQVRRMKALPLRFEAETDLREQLWQLLLLETLTALKSTLSQQRLFGRPCRLTSTSPQAERCVQVTFSPVVPQGPGEAARGDTLSGGGSLAPLGELVLLVRDSRDSQSRQGKTLAEWGGPPASGYTLGIVEREVGSGHDKAKAQGICVSVAFDASVALCSQTNRINSQLHSNTRWLLYSLASLTPVFREVEALIYLSLSPHLARPIMDPFGEASLQTQQREWIPEGPPEASAKNTDLCVSQAKAAYGLNPSQTRALAGVMSDEFDVSLIQGPPGTGKTQTVLAIIAALHARLRRESQLHPQGAGFLPKILVCAPSNAAVDEIAERILTQGLVYKKDDSRPARVVRPSCLRIGHPDRIRESVLPISFEQKQREAQGNFQALFAVALEAQVAPLRAQMEEVEKQIADLEKALAAHHQQSERLHQQRVMTDLAERIAARESGDGLSSSSLASSSDGSLVSRPPAPSPSRIKEAEIQCLQRRREHLRQRLAQSRVASQQHMGTLDMATKQKLLYEADIVFATLSGCGSEVLEPPEQETFSQQERLISARKFAVACVRESSSESVYAAREVERLFAVAAVRRELRFAFAVVDEAAQATESASLIPLKLNCRRLVLVGDPQQLPPLVLSRVALRKGLGRSTMARLSQVLKAAACPESSSPPSSATAPCNSDKAATAVRRADGTLAANRVALFFLDTQYRMHPEIAEFSVRLRAGRRASFRFPHQGPKAQRQTATCLSPASQSKEFYEGRLLSAPCTSRARLACFVAKCFGAVRLFDVRGICSRGGESPQRKPLGRRSEGRNSLCNFSEAATVVKLLTLLHTCWGRGAGGGDSQKEAICLSDVGVLSPYKAQVSLIQSLLFRVPEFENIPMPEVNTVDGFQGREKKIMIISFVRSLPSSEGGWAECGVSALWPDCGGPDRDSEGETDSRTPDAQSEAPAERKSEGQPRAQFGGGGFVADAQRLNVSLTRASHALWLVGDGQFFDHHDLLAKLKAFVRERQGVVTVGPSALHRGGDSRRLRPIEIEEWFEAQLRYCRNKRQIQQTAGRRVHQENQGGGGGEESPSGRLRKVIVASERASSAAQEKRNESLSAEKGGQETGGGVRLLSNIERRVMLQGSSQGRVSPSSDRESGARPPSQSPRSFPQREVVLKERRTSASRSSPARSPEPRGTRVRRRGSSQGSSATGAAALALVGSEGKEGTSTGRGLAATEAARRAPV